MTTRIGFLCLFVAGALGAANDAVDRCTRAGRLLDEIMTSPEKAVPRTLLAKAQCVALIPGVKKAAFVVGVRYGKGVIQCRSSQGWTGPSSVRLEGGSFGLQIGGSSTDVVLLVMNESGREKLLASKFTLGASAAVAGGPVGRSARAETDAQMRAKILTYSRSRGVFAGVSLAGATLRPDHEANEQIYGTKVAPEEILSGQIPAPATTADLSAALAKFDSEAHLAEIEEAPEPEADPVREPGLLAITSEPPFAEVEIDQNFNGLTPRKKALEPGEYKIRVSKAGFAPFSKTIFVSPGETTELHADLSAAEVASQTPESTVDESRQARIVKPASNSRITIMGLP